MLHDGRTKSYINSDVAAELGLNGPVETVTLSTLNGNVKTFQITSVKCEMGSTDGKVNHNVSTYTTQIVTAQMRPIKLRVIKMMMNCFCGMVD